MPTRFVCSTAPAPFRINTLPSAIAYTFVCSSTANTRAPMFVVQSKGGAWAETRHWTNAQNITKTAQDVEDLRNRRARGQCAGAFTHLEGGFLLGPCPVFMEKLPLPRT